MIAATIALVFGLGILIGRNYADKSNYQRGFFNGYQEGYSDAVSESIQDVNKIVNPK